MKFSIIGYGAVGRPFALGLIKSGAICAGIGLRADDPDRDQAEIDNLPISQIEDVPLDIDLLVIAVPDNSVKNISDSIAENHKSRKHINTRITNEQNPPVALHFAGRFGLSPLEQLSESGFKCLAWHPIQTFVKNVDPGRFRGIYAGITADENAWEMAVDIAERLGTIPLRVSEKDRNRYHNACVLVSNYLPLLMDLAASRLDGILDSREDAVKALLPLVQGMVENLGAGLPENAMTGPVARNELEAVHAHLLDWNDPSGRLVYLVLTRSLVDLAERYGRLTKDQAIKWQKELDRIETENHG